MPEIGNPKHNLTYTIAFCFVSKCLLPYKAFVEIKGISAKRPNGFLWTGTWLYIPNAWSFRAFKADHRHLTSVTHRLQVLWQVPVSPGFSRSQQFHHLDFESLRGPWTGLIWSWTGLIWSSKKHLQRSRQGQINVRINNSKLTVSHLKRTEQPFALYARVLLWKLRVHDLLPVQRSSEGYTKSVSCWPKWRTFRCDMSITHLWLVYDSTHDIYGNHTTVWTLD